MKDKNRNRGSKKKSFYFKDYNEPDIVVNNKNTKLIDPMKIITSHISGYKIFGISVNHLSCINLGFTDHDGTYKRIQSKNNPIRTIIAPIKGPLNEFLTLFHISHHQGIIKLHSIAIIKTYIIGPLINKSSHAASDSERPYQKTIKAE